MNNRDDLFEYKESLKNLTSEELKKRDLYLKKMAEGEIYGPPTGLNSIDKPWLKYYEEKDIKQDIPKMKVFDYLMLNNQNNLNKNAINYYGKKITFGQLYKNVQEITKSLISLGVKKGDVVTLAMASTPETVYIFYALNRIGAVCNVIDPRYSPEEMKRELNKADSKLFITLDMSYPNSRKIIEETSVEKTVCLTALESMPLPIKALASLKNERPMLDSNSLDWSDFIKNGKKVEDIQNVEYEENQPVALVHTGGTTGEPKAVMLTNENFIAMANMHMYGGLDYTKDDTFLNILPPFIAYCLCNGINMPLTLGLEVTLVPKLNVPEFPQILDKFKPNHVLAGPILWEYVCNSDIKDLSYLKTPVSGGDVLNPELERRINTFFKEHGCKFKVAQGYGMTEVSSAAVFSKEDANKEGSVGIPFIKNNVSIFDPDTFVEKRVGEEGEIWISTDTAMSGYYNNEEASKKLRLTTPDGKTWIRTSDIGKMDKDGNVFIMGRMKRMIVRNGNKIFPSNVENYILQVPGVENCAVVGLDDEIERKVPIVHIVLSEDSQYKKEEIVQMIKNIVGQNLPELNIPVKFIFRNEMPLTSINKIDFKTLEEEEIPLDEIIDKTITRVR